MNQSAEILCIGTELLIGDIVNTNAAYLARRLAEMGIPVYHQTVVGDNPDRLRAALQIAFSRADIVITTGGLGPTYDDLSKETVASFFGRKLVMDDASLKAIRSFFKRMNRPVSGNNEKQAMMPENCIIFPNPNGTAPGCAIEGDGDMAGKIAILLPGPPREMKPMFDESAAPFLERLSGQTLVSRNLHFFGIGESDLECRLHEMMTKNTNPTVAPYAKTGEVLVRVTARVHKKEEADALIDPVVKEICASVGEFLYGVDVGDLQTALVRLCREKGLTVAAAESCTGGMVAERITSVPGASEVFEWGVCSYSVRTKQELLGVDSGLLAEHGAVSAETAAAMAARARTLSGADIAVAVTGNAGPDPSEGKAVGLVYVAVDSAWHSEVLTLNLSRRDEDARAYIRTVASSHALNLALQTARRKP